MYYLKEHPDRSFVNKLYDGMVNGFDLGIDSPPTSSLMCRNLKSATDNSQFVSEAIKKEVDKGFVSGPFDTPPFDVFRASPIGVAVSKYSKKKRLILDLSSPHDDGENASINSLIDKDSFRLKYTTVDDAITIIKRLGIGAQLCKVDVESAFKILPIIKSQWPYVGFRWQHKFYFFKRLCFGCRSSPYTFNMLSEAIAWIAANCFQIENILYLLDDFLTIDNPSTDASITMGKLLYLFKSLNIPLSLGKCEGPSDRLIYLGVELCSTTMCVYLPNDKKTRIRELLVSFHKRRRCTKHELLQLIGHLSFAARCIAPCRAFMNKLIAAAYSVKQLRHHVRLSQETRSDINMWLAVMEDFNGCSMFLHDDLISNEDLEIYTDSSSSFGCGGYNLQSREYFSVSWEDLGTDFYGSKQMSLLELVPIVIAACLWSHNWRRKRVLWHCDNEGLCYILNKSRAKDKSIMLLLQKAVYLSVQNNFTFHARWLSTTKNRLADLLSRNDINSFQESAAGLWIQRKPPQWNQLTDLTMPLLDCVQQH